MKSARLAAVALLILVSGHLELRSDERRAADEATLKDAGLGSDGPALLRFFQQRTLSEAEQARLAAEVRRLGDESFAEREKAMKELRAAGRSAFPFLRPAARDGDPEIAQRSQRLLKEMGASAELAQTHAATRLLADRKPAGTVEVVLRFLPVAGDDILEEELLSVLVAVGFTEGKVDPALTLAAKDPLPIRRAAAAWVLGRANRPEDRATVRPLLGDSDPRVRWRAAQALLIGKEKEAISTLIALLEEAPALGWQAEELLFRIAGDKAPPVALGVAGATERRQCREAWTRWWRDQENTIDLSRLDLQARGLGRTLFACFEGYKNGKGRVWEVAADGKVIWEIDNITGASDVQVLPGNRVLLSEYYGDPGVSERDMTGKVLWKHRIINTLGCQRLPNGNTFIAGYSELLELSPEGKPVFSFKHNAIFCGRKLRNGHYAYADRNGVIVELDEKGKAVQNFKAGLEWCSTFDVLTNGHYLVPQRSAGKVVEFDPTGRVVWECSVSAANTAARLPNGHTLVGTGAQGDRHTIVEVDRSGKVLSEQVVQGRVFRIVAR